MNNKQGITFKAIFYKATSLVDGGWRVSFDLSAQDWAIAAELSQTNQVLQVGIVPVPDESSIADI